MTSAIPVARRVLSLYITCLLLMILLLPLTGMGQARTTGYQNITAPPDLLWDLPSLHQVPQHQWLDSGKPVRSLLYRSVDFEGRPSEVFAYYSDPDLLLGRAASGKKYPALVLVHGGGGTAFREWAEKWAAEGYAAIAMDLSGRDGAGKPLENAGPGQTNDDKFTRISGSPLQDIWSYHAVASIILAHSWLRAQPAVDSTRTGITGISWGGYLTCIAGSLDTRFKAAVPVYGCGFYDESDIFKVSLQGLSAGDKTKWMRYFDPSVYLPGAKTRFLFLNGNKDRFYNVVPYHKTYSLVRPEYRNVSIIPEMRHSHYHGWEPHEIRYFMNHILNGAPALPIVHDVRDKGDSLEATCSSPVTLHMAEFYYSNDTQSLNEVREWKVQKAEIDRNSGKIRAKKPAGGFIYGFFYVRDHRNVSASSEFILND